MGAPTHGLYRKEFHQKLEKLGIKGEQRERLCTELVIHYNYYRGVINRTPTDFPIGPPNTVLSERLEWIDAQVLNPLTRLLDAVDPKNRHMFSLWPEEVVDELLPNFDDVMDSLNQLQILSWNVAIVIAKYKRYDLPHTQLLRFRIVDDIARAIDEALPDIKPSRGTYDAEDKKFYGIYPELIRVIYTAFTEEDEQLDRLIKEQVDKRTGK